MAQIFVLYSSDAANERISMTREEAPDADIGCTVLRERVGGLALQRLGSCSLTTDTKSPSLGGYPTLSCSEQACDRAHDIPERYALTGTLSSLWLHDDCHYIIRAMPFTRRNSGAEAKMHQLLSPQPLCAHRC
jgi:hypothetical protein